MRVEVKEHLETLVLLSLLHYCLARRPDSWIVSLGRVEVHPIQIASHCVQSVIASRDTVWIQHHDDLEDVAFPEALPLFTSHVTEYLEEAVKNVGSGCLSRVHPRCQEYHWLLFTEAERARVRVLLSGRKAASCRDSLDLVRDLVL